ncbi:hypothetical protein TKK_0004823 [Trichogramma kaykai]
MSFLCGVSKKNIKNKSALLIYPFCLKDKVIPIAKDIEKINKYNALSWWTANDKEVAEAGGAYNWAKMKMLTTKTIIMFNHVTVDNLFKKGKAGNEVYEGGPGDLAFLTIITDDLPKFEQDRLDLIILDLDNKQKTVWYPKEDMGLYPQVKVPDTNYFLFPREKEKFYKKLESEGNDRD